MEPTKSPSSALWTYKNQVFLKKPAYHIFSLLIYTYVIVSIQALAAFSASLSFFVTGEVRGWASPSVPSLQGHDGLNNSLSYAPLTKEAASWISITELSECRDTKNIEIFFIFENSQQSSDWRNSGRFDCKRPPTIDWTAQNFDFGLFHVSRDFCGVGHSEAP